MGKVTGPYLVRTLAIFVLLLTALVIAGLALFYSITQTGTLPVTTTPTLAPALIQPVLASASTPTPTAASAPGPAPEPSPSSTATEVMDAKVEEWLGSMSVEEKVGQLLIIGIPGTTLDDQTRQLLSSVHPGGVVYLKRNAMSFEQVKALNEALQAESSIPLFIAVDHEGGHVMRFPPGSGFTHFPPPWAIRLAGCSEYAYDIARASGAELRTAGFNMVLGPVADVNTEADNPVIGTRAFGDDPDEVAVCVENSVRGYMDVGLIPVLKHFPGHGGVKVDSHRGLPVDTSDIETLRRVYLVPFARGIEAGAPVIMMSHVTFPNIQPDGLPASLSPFFIRDILRTEMGFDGPVMSDAVGMGAVSQQWGPDTGAVMAVKAGEDLILTVDLSIIKPVYDALLKAVQSGDIPMKRIDEAVRRVLNLKASGILDPLELAVEVSRKTVSLFYDPQHLIPIKKGAKILLVTPDNLDKGDVEGNGLSYLGETLAADYNVREFFYHIPRYTPISEPDLLATIPAQAGEFDVVIFCTRDAHLRNLQFNDEWQIQLASALRNHPLILVALRSPYDYKALPPTGAYLATYGATRPQLKALADVLKGALKPREFSDAE